MIHQLPLPEKRVSAIVCVTPEKYDVWKATRKKHNFSLCRQVLQAQTLAKITKTTTKNRIWLVCWISVLTEVEKLMNPQPEEDLQRRLNQLEAEINSPPGAVPQPQEPKQTPQSVFANLNLQLERFKIWFNSLSGTKKLVVAGVTVLVGLAMLQAVFKLVASVISLALLAVLVYVGYKFFVSGSFQRKQ